MGVYFGGKYYITPTTASAVVDSAMVSAGSAIGNLAAIVGISTGGKPKTPLLFSSPEDAKKTLIAGDLLDAVLAAFNPSNETGGPSQVVAVRVNPADQAIGFMKDSGGNNVIALASTDYGANANLIQHKVEAGSISGLRVTVQQGTTYYTQDNIQRRVFSIKYTGPSGPASMTIGGTTLTLVYDSKTTIIDLTAYTTAQNLVNRLNIEPGFTASVLDGNYAVQTTNALDYVTTQSVGAEPYIALANLQAVIDWLNGASENLVDATRVTNAGNPPAVAPFHFLSGGADGSPSNLDWSDGFTALQSYDVAWVSAATSDPSIAAMTDAHVVYMSTVGRKERRAIIGTALSTSNEGAIAAAASINSDRTAVVHLGHYNYNESGQLHLYPPYITAALLVGMFSAVSPGTPLTNKVINVRGLERILTNPSETDTLLNGGVMPLESTERGYLVTQSISSCLWSNKYNRHEMSTGAALDFVAKSIRKALDVLRGSKSDPILLGRYVSTTDSVLRGLAIPEPNGPGVIVGDKLSPAYRGITATMTGDVVQVSFQCSPVIPNNYAFTTIYAVPYSGTATL